jgi:hypothetical protein
MGDWQEIKRKKSEMLQEIAATLSDQERNILVRVLELEIEQRHRKRVPQEVRDRLRDFTRQEITDK